MCICVYMCPHVFTCGRVCSYMWYYLLSIGNFVTFTAIHVLCWSLYMYRIVGTQYGFSPLCVANFFVLGLLLILLLDLMFIIN